MLVVALAALFLLVACGGAGADVDGVSGSNAGPSAAPSGAVVPEPSAMAIEPDASAEGPCRQVGLVQASVADLNEVELRFANRVALEIALGKVQAAFAELNRAELGMLEDQLEDPLRRLGYRLVDLEIAVEDFRTNRRPRPAAVHVEDDAGTFRDAIDSFAILARC